LQNLEARRLAASGNFRVFYASFVPDAVLERNIVVCRKSMIASVEYKGEFQWKLKLLQILKNSPKSHCKNGMRDIAGRFEQKETEAEKNAREFIPIKAIGCSRFITTVAAVSAGSNHLFL